MTAYERQLLTRRLPAPDRPGDRSLSNSLMNMIIVGVLGLLLTLALGSLVAAAADSMGVLSDSNPKAPAVSDNY